MGKQTATSVVRFPTVIPPSRNYTGISELSGYLEYNRHGLEARSPSLQRKTVTEFTPRLKYRLKFVGIFLFL